jgi:hypothetical protein
MKIEYRDAPRQITEGPPYVAAVLTEDDGRPVAGEVLFGLSYNRTGAVKSLLRTIPAFLSGKAKYEANAACRAELASLPAETLKPWQDAADRFADALHKKGLGR